MRSSGTQIRGTIGDNIMEWKGQEQDVSLMIKMQQKLKEAQAAKEKLERRVEHLESSLAAEATADKKQPADLVRVSLDITAFFGAETLVESLSMCRLALLLQSLAYEKCASFSSASRV